MNENILSRIQRFYRSCRERIPVRKILGLKPRADYWQSRSDLYYYKIVKALIDNYPPGNLIVDIGGWDTPGVTWGNFKNRLSVDLYLKPRNNPKIQEVKMDWMKYKLNQRADLVVCLQVLEHIPDGVVNDFAKKILNSCQAAVISAPYKWPKGKCIHHLQDPVDLEKLESWFGQKSLKYYIETRDKDQRLIAVFKGCVG